jgi:ATP-binding cassette subfamily F protein 3
LILAKLLNNPPNFLLLDEPTTHLDVDAVEALVRALNDYEGAIVFISHDIYFVRSVANSVFEVKNGRIRKFPGRFDYYLEKKDSVILDLQETGILKPKEKKKDIDEEKLKEREEEKKEKEEIKKRKKIDSTLKEKIDSLGKKREKLRLESYAKARAMSDSRFFHDEDRAKEYGRRLKEIKILIEEIDKEIKDLKSKLKADKDTF